MTRILADLPADDIAWLDRSAAEQGRSRAALVREAISHYRASSEPLERPAPVDLSWLDAGFGLWARHGIADDPHEYERRRRAEWTRPWDDDYEEVRAGSPDMFDAEDDRQRQIHLDMVAGKHPIPKYPDQA